MNTKLHFSSHRFPDQVSGERFVITDGMSDHYPCLLSYNILNSSRKNDIHIIEKRKFTDQSIARIQQHLLFHDWMSLNDPAMSVNEMYGYFNNVVNEILDLCAPVKHVEVKRDDQFTEPWLTVNILKCNRKCRRLCNKAKSGGLSDQTKYKMYRNTLNKIKSYEK